MSKVGNYSINPEIKSMSLDKFTELVGDAFKLVPEKDREEEIKKAYEQRFGKVKRNSKKSETDRPDEDSRAEDSGE